MKRIEKKLGVAGEKKQKKKTAGIGLYS